MKLGVLAAIAFLTTLASAAVRADDATPRFQYMFGESSVPAIAGDPAASAALNGTHPFINLKSASPPYPSGPFAPAAWGAQYVARWGSERQMERDIDKLPSWVTYCMYDNETNAEPRTPSDEVADAEPFYESAGQICHKAGKKFIATAGVMGAKNSAKPLFTAAKYWDGYSMQTQTRENNMHEFTSEIENFRSSVQAINPSVKLFIVGIGDFAGGTFQPLPAVENVARAVPQGMPMWLNFGVHNGPHCRDTSVCPIPAHPEMEAQLIKDLGP